MCVNASSTSTTSWVAASKWGAVPTATPMHGSEIAAISTRARRRGIGKVLRINRLQDVNADFSFLKKEGCVYIESRVIRFEHMHSFLTCKCFPGQTESPV
jgi:hypothetical protein